jgi:hypothetical protein
MSDFRTYTWFLSGELLNGFLVASKLLSKASS